MVKAFPTVTGAVGMDLRDYFAAQALTGIQMWDAILNGKNSVLAENGVNELAKISYAVADAMMKARDVHPEND
jgi:hypothetical protein